MHITLTGNLGSGKSTICKFIVSKYGYESYSTGKIQRKLAEDFGISVLEMNQLMQSDKKYDNMIDDAVTKISIERKDTNIIFDSRLAWHFAVDTFKVFLSVSLDEAARRVYNDNRGDVENYSSLADACNQLKKRADTEDIRYKDIYQLDYFNCNNYNLILDSTFLSPEFLSEVIIREKRLYEESMAYSGNNNLRILMSPKRLCDTASEIEEDLANYFYDSKEIPVLKQINREYCVDDGIESIQKAASLHYPLILCKINNKLI